MTLQLWGGVECTVNRVGDRYYDQMALSGHAVRPEDLLLVAELGIRTLRQPVLWEYVAPDRPDRPNWTWTDERLGLLRQLEIRPIVGLLHHGSGPRYTNLMDLHFPEKLAVYARQVAERYPWVEAWTPVNEPLTTARFSGLYGHWYPHHCDDRSFVLCLLHQLRGVVLAMREIRRVQPYALLVQTEDLGKTHAMPALADQARFENDRRWLTWDLLEGRVGPHHPLYRYLSEAAGEAEVRWFADNPCPPDVVGANHYVTSERFLDDRLEHYPSLPVGGNGHQIYVDVEAVRVGISDGIESLLRSVWRRYRRPIAVTEAHLGCTPDEQVRWLSEVWCAAASLQAEGVDIGAVTTWALFGAHDWDSLVTQIRGSYEPGAFDVSGAFPQPTPVSELVRNLAAGHEPPDTGPGWWRRPDRLFCFLQSEEEILCASW